MKILMIGLQGSGKSTQANLLSEFLGIPRISTGDVFRELAESGSEEGRRFGEIMSSGQLIDDKITAEIVRKKIESGSFDKGFILDGYPRNLNQKDLYDPKINQAFYLKVPEEEVIRRLSARGRVDDSPEAIKKRLDLYLEQTEPLLEYYRSQGILSEIDGQGSIEEIQNEIRKNLKA